MLEKQECTDYQVKNQFLSSIFSKGKISRVIIAGAVLVLDYIAIVAAVCTAYLMRASVVPLYHENFNVPEVYIYIIIPAAFLLFLHFDLLYFHRLYFWQQAERLFKVSIYAILVVVVFLYFSGSAKYTSRIFIGLVWILGFVYLLMGRYLLKKIIVSVGLFQVPTVLIGGGKTAELLLNAFQHSSGSRYKIVGLIEDNPEKSSVADQYPVLGAFADADRAILKAGVKNVLIAAPGLSREALVNLVYRIQPHVDNITFVPNLFGVPVESLQMETLFEEKTVLLKIRNNLAQIHNRVLKILFDSVCSLLGLIVVVPVMIVISLLIYIDSPGPVIFSHYRVGREGKLFPCYKFRTMVVDAQRVLENYLTENEAARKEWEQDFKLRDDPRITKVGKFLRKTSLDELPQFLNVLKGEMSLVGPRPIIQKEIVRYGDYINDYYLVRPGITGIWQVSGRNDIDYPQRVKMDSWYTRNWSLWIDIVILIKTVKIVLGQKGAY